MSTPVRVAVVGAGVMGRNHLRVYDGLKDVEVVAVVDADHARAREVAAAVGCEAVARIEDLVGRVDAASITVTSVAHAEVAVPLLEAGIHCLVEKPLATTEADAEAIIAAASGPAQLLVGHIERFNPVVRQLKAIIGDGRDVLAVDARRMNSVRRVIDVDVVADLMVHDLDVVMHLVDDEVVDVTARGVRRGGSQGQDYVNAIVTFRGGALASFTASRVTENKIRSLEVTTTRQYYSLQYATQELLVHRQGTIGRLSDDDDGQYVLELATDRVFVRNAEPLLVELGHFARVARGLEAPEVTGRQGLDALRMVWRVQEEVGAGVDVTAAGSGS